MKITLSVLLGVFSTPFLWGSVSMGAQFCAENAEALQAALTAAQSNGEDDLIHLVQGHYDVLTLPGEDPNFPETRYPIPFVYESDEGRSIALLGGFTEGCVSRNLDPANTILEGAGTQALRMRNTRAGDILLEGVTVQNGGETFGGRAGVELFASSTPAAFSEGRAGNIFLQKNVFYRNGARHAPGVAATTDSTTVTPAAGEIIVTGNLFKENHSDWNSAGLEAASVSPQDKGGAIRLVNNLFVGNSNGPYGEQQGNALKLSTWGDVVLTNNTITGNDGSGDAAVLVARAGTLLVYNNIVWGNTAPELNKPDILVHRAGSTYGFNNNYALMVDMRLGQICRIPLKGFENCPPVVDKWSGSGGNLNADPLFEDAASGNFHLQRVSLMIDSGSADAPDLPETDFEGNPRANGDPSLTGPYPDIGAFEYIRPSPPQQPTLVNPTSLEDVEKAPIKLRMMGCETKVMETLVNLGPYRSPVDLYLAMGRPRRHLFSDRSAGGGDH